MDIQLQDTDGLGARDGDYTRGGYPKRSPVVLGTIRPGYKAPKYGYEEPLMEYRIGIMTAVDFEIGLWCRNTEQHRLNPRTARQCFGESPVFFDKDEAIAAARPLLAKAGCGIKVRNFNERWPGTHCSILQFPA